MEKKNNLKGSWRLSCSLKSWLHICSLEYYNSKERENNEARAESQSAASSQAGQKNVAAVTKTPWLHGFVDGKNNLGNYLLQFDRYAAIAGWLQNAWTVRLSPLLTAKTLDVYLDYQEKGFVTEVKFYRVTIS